MSAAVIAHTRLGTGDPDVLWARCTACQRGVVINGGEVAPQQLAGQPVDGLPAETQEAYLEARKDAGVGAFTSCELMCRKILMHVAVEKGAPPGDTFANYLTHLSDAGFVTPPMAPWVDHIRKRGNAATHELPSSDESEALGTLGFTAQLLVAVFEMEHRMRQFLPGAAGRPTAGETAAPANKAESLPSVT